MRWICWLWVYINLFYTQGKKKRTTYFLKVFARILWNQMYVFESHICPWHFSPVIWDSRLARSRTCTIFTMPVLFPKKKMKILRGAFLFSVSIVICEGRVFMPTKGWSHHEVRVCNGATIWVCKPIGGSMPFPLYLSNPQRAFEFSDSLKMHSTLPINNVHT